MKKISNFIIKYNKIFLIIFAILLVMAIIELPFVINRINSDITAYLPENSLTSSGQQFLSENFGIQSNLTVAVGDATDVEMKSIITKIKKIKGVQTPIWANSEEFKLLEYSEPEKAKDLKSKFIINGKYLIYLMVDYPASSNEAFEVVDKIDKILKDKPHAIGGMVTWAKSLFKSTIYELPTYASVAISVVIIILFLTTVSYIEPLILILTLIVSVILNLGSNIIFPSTSIITFATAALLQMALSMDYAIILTHRFNFERKQCIDAKEALKKALPQTMSSIVASALTTIFGFLALYLMEFKIGADLGGVLAKGIILSLLTVIFLQPALILLMRKSNKHGMHKCINFKIKKTSKFLLNKRTSVVVLVISAIVPILVGQFFLNYNYLKFQEEIENPNELEKMVEDANNQIIICVPIKCKNITYEEKLKEIEKQFEFVKELKSEDYVKDTMGIFTIIDDVSKAYFATLMMDNSFFLNNEYTLYTITLNTDDLESDYSLNALDSINNKMNKYFNDKVYITGMGQVAKDFAEITPRDFIYVATFSAVAIFIILLLTLKSFKYSFVLVLLIEFGIWINLFIEAVTGVTINFMSYIIISAIQLGATVDYAILITVRYKQCLKKGMNVTSAVYKAVTESAMSIMTSASIMVGSCMSVYFLSSNLIVAEMTMLIARGCLISGVLVLFVLPSILAFIDSKKHIGILENELYENKNYEPVNYFIFKCFINKKIKKKKNKKFKT